MHPEIEKRLADIDERSRRLVDRVKALPSDQQAKQPAKNEFSPIELIQHMALVDFESVRRMKKISPKDLAGKKPKPSFMYRNVVKSMREGKKSPTPPSMQPKIATTLEKAEADWIEARKQLRGFFEMVATPDDCIQKFWLFGTMSASQLLDLFESHLDYHEKRFPAV